LLDFDFDWVLWSAGDTTSYSMCRVVVS
jgi:hypothetical protein